MTAMVIWPGATSQQIQDEVLNRMEKEFEQIDHYEKIVTFSRQGFGGMTLTVRGGTSKDDQREAWYWGAQEVQRHQARAARRRRRPNLQRRVRRRLQPDVRRQGRRHGPGGTRRHRGGRQAAPAQVPMVKKVDVLGRQGERVYVEFSHERLAALGITPLQIAESLRRRTVFSRAAQSTRAATASSYV